MHGQQNIKTRIKVLEQGSFKFCLFLTERIVAVVKDRVFPNKFHMFTVCFLTRAGINL